MLEDFARGIMMMRLGARDKLITSHYVENVVVFKFFSCIAAKRDASAPVLNHKASVDFSTSDSQHIDPTFVTERIFWFRFHNYFLPEPSVRLSTIMITQNQSLLSKIASPPTQSTRLM